MIKLNVKKEEEKVVATGIIFLYVVQQVERVIERETERDREREGKCVFSVGL